ncbi:MAG: hypothetical protein GY756_10820 [bacterium]|nr:hypothetical protein [bacterium]
MVITINNLKYIVITPDNGLIEDIHSNNRIRSIEQLDNELKRFGFRAFAIV